MTNKNPKTRIVAIPAQFLPLIEKERERRGCFSQHECMGYILKDYFGTNGIKSPEKDNPDQVIKGEKIHAGND